MKIEKVIILFLLLITIASFSQTKDTIRGKLFFSHSFYNKFSLIIVKESDTKMPVVLNKNGEFELIPKVNKKYYDLVFSYKGNTFRKFKFKQEWTKRKRPKSISLNEKCNASKQTALADMRNEEVKFYIFDRNFSKSKRTNKDKRVAKRYNFEYISLKRIEQFDCYLNYNEQILRLLPLKVGNKFIDELNKNVIGLN